MGTVPDNIGEQPHLRPEMMDLAPQGGQDSLMESLVNFPIALEEKREILKVRKSNVCGGASKGKQPQGKKVSKRWKRVRGKENAEPSPLELRQDSRETAQKRSHWFLQDEEDEPNDRMDSSKRLKGTVEFSTGSNSKVGVANLNWPQMNQ